MTHVQEFHDIYVDGAWVPSDGTGNIEVRNPATEEVIATVVNGTASDVARAVAAAKRALPGWSALPPTERASWLRKAHESLIAKADHLAAVITTDMGMPLAMSSASQVGLPTFNLGHFADLAESFDWEGEQVGNSLVVR